MQEYHSTNNSDVRLFRVNMKISNTCMKTIGSNKYKEVLESNKFANGILTTIWEKVKFSYKDRQMFINIFA